MKVPFGDRMVDASEVEPVASNEFWNEYQIGNGEVLYTKVVLVRALRANDVKAPDGTPFYSVQTQVLVKVKQ